MISCSLFWCIVSVFVTKQISANHIIFLSYKKLTRCFYLLIGYCMVRIVNLSYRVGNPLFEYSFLYLAFDVFYYFSKIFKLSIIGPLSLCDLLSNDSLGFKDTTSITSFNTDSFNFFPNTVSPSSSTSSFNP